jgi:hypothetical protein
MLNASFVGHDPRRTSPRNSISGVSTAYHVVQNGLCLNESGRGQIEPTRILRCSPVQNYQDLENSQWSLTMARTLKRMLGPPLILAAAFVVVLCQVSLAQGDADLEAPGLEPFATPSSNGATLFQNVRIFGGRSPALSAPSNVLVRGDTIERISTSPITVDKNANVRVIAADGRVLMPGLIDAHWHAFMRQHPRWS